MDTIFIEATSNTPQVILDQKHGLIEFSGRSIMEDPRSFYDPLFDWILDYAEKPKDTIVTIDFEYFNSPTNKFFQIFFTLLNDIRKKGFKLIVYWVYDKNDEDIWETGREFSNISGIEFIYIERSYDPLTVLKIGETELTPKIKLDPDNGLIEISGKSIMDDIRSFFLPLMDWLIKYSKEPKNTIVSIDVESFNETTNMFFLTLFNMLAEIKLQGYYVKVDWFYNKNDLNTLEPGQRYAFLSDLEFNYIDRTLN